MKPLFLLLLAAATAPAADQKATIASLNQRLAANDQTIAGLRKELSDARATIQERIENARTGLEFQVQGAEARLATARAQTEGANRTIGAQRDQIAQLTQQLAAAGAHSADTSRVAALAESAVQNAVKVASTRHAQDAADLKSTGALAGSAADHAKTAAELGKANSKALGDARKQITNLKTTLDRVTEEETRERHLTVFVAIFLAAIAAVLFARRRWTIVTR